MPVVRDGLPNALIPAGTLDDDPGVKPSMHIFVRDKAPWFSIDDDLLQAKGWPLEKNIEEIGSS